MSYTFEEGKDEVLKSVVSEITQKMPAPTSQLCSEFVRQFFGTVAPDDLTSWKPSDFYGAAVNFWQFIENKTPGETKIHLYNPDFEKHGWESTHTVIEVMTDDKPFIVASLRVLLNRMNLTAHLVVNMGGIRLCRNASGDITHIYPKKGAHPKDSHMEAPVFIFIDRVTDVTKLNQLKSQISRVLEDNRLVVEDWVSMREKVKESIASLRQVKSIKPEEIEETVAFLNWIEDNHFTFLGIKDYDLAQKDKEVVLESVPHTGLGLLRPNASLDTVLNLAVMKPDASDFTDTSRILMMSKTSTLSNVHRDAYTDYIGIKRFNNKGEVIGERRVIGLYTSAAYNTNPKHIPLLRHKVSRIMHDSGFNPKGHTGKILLNILDTLPRDDLIQGTDQELLDMAMGIYYLQERKRIRLFARMDVYRRFISCLVYVPKDRFKTELRVQMENILSDAFNAERITFSTYFSESVLARIHFVIHLQPDDKNHYDFEAIEQKLVEAGRSWEDDLESQLIDVYGEEKGNRLFAKYHGAFPGAYSDNFSAQVATHDISHIESLSAHNRLEVNFYSPLDGNPNHFRFKVYQHHSTIVLSDVLPILEHMGLRVINERPYELKYADGASTWINEFALVYPDDGSFSLEQLRDTFQDAFRHIWFGDAENDGFNKLVLAAGLSWREVIVLRAYAKYFKQIGLKFSQDYIEKALFNNAKIAQKIIKLFETRFDPAFKGQREAVLTQQTESMLKDLDAVTNLDEDRILRQYIHTIAATLRTNFYQTDDKGEFKPYMSMKFNSKQIPNIPKPYPRFEIFMYSPRVEGVHLRGAKVARGGLRWSDRREDFRTEILGLMKAQQVKNAVIVPSGAKGGFVPKKMPLHATREEVMAEGIACYQLFIRSLLDITDNLVKGALKKPKDVVCHDEDDPYLVVAADKGTATFSDIANAISLERDFWLGDAFASGGSVGYDHKKMGITAKGAWESVKRHFRGLSKDIQTQDFSVIGIGDMAGDVFGNGMLLSKHIKLLGAFNHVHIFIDPNPNPETSFKERERMFHLPRSTWMDYDAKLISKGGGVFERAAKSIPVSKEMKAAFGIHQSTIEPNELIRHLLKAEVDLLWSAGIGTFVKAKSESNAEAGDRANDSIRIDGHELRCKVIGEGGNLGITQLGRVEYALHGGLCYTDFIDNSAGVNCSDKEVNIKILLNSIVQSGDLTEKHRNELLSEMTDNVSSLVLRDNYLTSQSIDLTLYNAPHYALLHKRYIKDLERSGKLDRVIEFLPDDKMINDRIQHNKGLTAPEISVLVCYSKNILKEQIIASDIPEDPFLEEFLRSSFPVALQNKYPNQMLKHPLKREIIATKISNILVNEMGPTFVYRLQQETNASPSDVVKAYLVARTIFNLESVFQQIEALDGLVVSQVQIEMMIQYVRLMRRVTRWTLKKSSSNLQIKNLVKMFKPEIDILRTSLPHVLSQREQEVYAESCSAYEGRNVPKKLAHEMAITPALFAANDIVQVAKDNHLNVEKAAALYFQIGDHLDLSWIRSQVITQPTTNHWEGLSREALRDDLDSQQRQLTSAVIHVNPKAKDLMQNFDIWCKTYESLVDKWAVIQHELRQATQLNYTMFFVAMRELMNLTQSSLQKTELKP